MTRKDPVAEVDLADQDILDAMGEIDGYLDISTADARAVYRLAHRHALERLFRGISAEKLMRRGIAPLGVDVRLDAAARELVAQGRKGLPVIDDTGRVVGMLTETDFLRRLKADSFLQLLLRMVAAGEGFSHLCHQTSVGEAMSAPAVTVSADAGFGEIAESFHGHAGRGMPVVDANGGLLGLLLRKDVIRACHLEAPL
jgi:CBS-domain-containing membrane protein